MWMPCVLIFHLVVSSPHHDVSLQVISCPQLPPFFFALTHSRQQTHNILAISRPCQPFFFFTIVRDERRLNEVWFSTERHSPTCVSHSHCTGFDKLCKHCVTQHHFRDSVTCTFKCLKTIPKVSKLQTLRHPAPLPRQLHLRFYPEDPHRSGRL